MAISSLGDLIDLACSRAPESGVIDEFGQHRSWPELDARIGRWAGGLEDSGVGAGDLVVIVHPKSVISFIAMHAVVRIGAIAVPVDPFGPASRFIHIVQDTQPAAIVTNDSTMQRLGSAALTAANQAQWFTDIAESNSVGTHTQLDSSTRIVERSRVGDDQAAYIIFTSGSTGTPKGIIHTHRSALAYAEHAAEVHRLDHSARVAGTSPLHFDMSTLELYAVPLSGASAVTVQEQVLLFPASLASLIEDRSVSHLYAVPYQLKQLLQRGNLAERDLSSVRQVSFGGEQFSVGSLRAVGDAFNGAELLNVYGPAEVNGVLSHSFGFPPQPFESVPIGTAWPNVELKVVDQQGELVAPGDKGELLIQSSSRMSGYWKDTHRTEASFVDSGRTWYRSGDLVHCDPNGRLHFHGRIDNRVKVRGVRVELEEIEHVLADADGVAHIAVDVVSDGVAEAIHAWVVAVDLAAFDPNDVLRYARKHLPSAALPTSIRLVSAMPTTQSGKIDRLALSTTKELSPKDAPTGR